MKSNKSHYPEIATRLQALKLSGKQVNTVLREACRCLYETPRHLDADRQWMLAGSMAEKVGKPATEDWKALADRFYEMFQQVYGSRTALLRAGEQTMRIGIQAAWRQKIRHL